MTSGDRLPADSENAVKAALQRCWSIDPNAPMDRVLIHVIMNPDGTVREATVADPDRYATDESYRDAADRALRAVMHPQCQPLPFPGEDWPVWRNLTLVFDTRDSFRGNGPPVN